MKKFLILFFAMAFLITGKSFAQNSEFGNFAAIRLTNGDLLLAGERNGTIYYDLNDNTFKFRQNGIWVELGGGGPVGGVEDGDKGDITVSGSATTWLIDNGAVTFPKFQTIATSRLLGRVTASTGLVEELTGTQVNSILPTFTTGAKGLVPLSPGGTTNFLRADGTWADPATSGTGGTTETASNMLTKVGSDIQLGGAQTVGTTLTLNADPAMPFAVVEDVSDVALIKGGSFGFNNGLHLVAGDYVNRTNEYTRLTPAFYGIELYAENAANENVFFRVSAGNSGLNTVYTDNKVSKTGIEYSGPGYVTQPRSLTTKEYVDAAVLAASGSDIPNGDKGDITVSNNGLTWDIDNDAVSYAEIQNVNGLRILGRSSSTSGDVQELTGTTVTTMLNEFTSTIDGIVPASGGGTTNFLRADGTWAAPPSGGGGGTINGTATAGQVAYGTVSNTIGSEAAFAYDANTDKLTVGKLDIANTPVDNGGAAAQMLVRNISTGDVEFMAVEEGSYTPTYTPMSGNPNSFEAYPQMYMRIGNRCTVSGQIDFNHTANSTVAFIMSLPVDDGASATIYLTAGGASSNSGTQFTISRSGNGAYFNTGVNTVSGTSTVITYTLMYSCI